MWRSIFRGIGSVLWAAVDVGVGVTASLFPDRIRSGDDYHLSLLGKGFFIVAAIGAVHLARMRYISERVAIAGSSAGASKDFQRIYEESLTEAAYTLQHLEGNSVRTESLERFVHDIVMLSRAIVQGYYQEASEKAPLGINANVMLRRAVTSKAIADYEGLHFYEPNKDMAPFLWVLELNYWADQNQDAPRRLVLPVNADRQKVLPGAPKAFDRGAVQVIGDTHSAYEIEHACGSLDREAKRSLVKFFHDRKSFRSFASLPIKFEGEPIGVMNVHSLKPRLFGETDTDDFASRQKSGVISALTPLTAMLACVLQRLASEMGKSTEGAPPIAKESDNNG